MLPRSPLASRIALMVGIFVGLSWPACMAAEADPEALADFLVKADAAGRGMGLVLMEPDGRLTAALAKPADSYVHGCTWEAGTVQAARDWLTTGETAVNDLPAGPVSGMSGRQRLLTTGARQAASAAKKEARREEKRRQARAMVESGSAWREVRNTLNLTYDFSREECERLKNELFGG